VCSNLAGLLKIEFRCGNRYFHLLINKFWSFTLIEAIPSKVSGNVAHNFLFGIEMMELKRTKAIKLSTEASGEFGSTHLLQFLQGKEITHLKSIRGSLQADWK
jgi:hypothetical protein